MSTSDAQRQTLIASLRQRWARAEQTDDAEAKQALFKEAVYLGIQPEEFTADLARCHCRVWIQAPAAVQSLGVRG